MSDQIQPQPTPFTFEAADAFVEGTKAVILTIHTVVGPFTIFIPAEQAIIISDIIREKATGLYIPKNGDTPL